MRLPRLLGPLALAACLALVGCSGGSPTSPDDDGTPDQGSGDFPGTGTPGDDDGTPDQGSGDQPGTGTPGDDDGTPDQGSGDRP